MTTPISSLLLIGCGKMGGALLDRWQQAAGITHFDVVEPQDFRASTTRVTWHQHLDSYTRERVPDVIVLAVKPQQLSPVLTACHQKFGQARPLYLSIAAGKTIAFLTRELGGQAHVVRAMPNTPAMIGRGVTALASANTLPESTKHIATALMQAVGKVEWVDEALMDAVTSISGSGPAYVFLFLDALTKAAIAGGMSANMAKTFALETVAGSCELAAHSSESFAQLRKNVTSPNGTTEAALNVLMQGDGFEKLINDAVKAAAKRSRELAE